ncbi:hypothetical protein GCK72_005012 [Caenorhabditis remanei]|uniref:Uncharacterized protein n=1 Tax=Caenorhabditis remanei TaxID=31234 RepID=A0A6A5HDP8_CAERE|nr:hypothetical protein GCK72_005012 [Caenorhabditis remanei]KAF1765061.1 hypothetical protein GCK72_005012 [Caenorhabditis remanei]
MSLIGKVALALVVVLAIGLVESTVHHRHHKKGSFNQPEEHIKLPRVSGVNPDYHISGKISCDERPLDHVRPYLHSPHWQRVIINLAVTMNGGEYHLSTGTTWDLNGSVQMMIRHQCHIEGLPPISTCGIPYYTTNFEMELGNNTWITKDIDLYKMKQYSTSDCLY